MYYQIGFNCVQEKKHALQVERVCGFSAQKSYFPSGIIYLQTVEKNLHAIHKQLPSKEKKTF